MGTLAPVAVPTGAFRCPAWRPEDTLRTTACRNISPS